jgi:hypothetical protein
MLSSPAACLFSVQVQSAEGYPCMLLQSLCMASFFATCRKKLAGRVGGWWVHGRKIKTMWKSLFGQMKLGTVGGQG